MVYMSMSLRPMSGANFNIDALSKVKHMLEALLESLDKTSTMYKMEISAKKTKLMTNSISGIQREVKVKIH